MNMARQWFCCVDIRFVLVRRMCGCVNLCNDFFLSFETEILSTAGEDFIFMGLIGWKSKASLHIRRKSHLGRKYMLGLET